MLTDRSLDCFNLGARTRREPLLRNRDVDLTLRVKLCGRGLRAEADAARRLPHVSRRAAGGVPPPALVS